ncbi:MAG: AgmX/PglI C-terminal domain-containing protein [candidate division KSB1 bacterium]|nr:AgmX/PglI C-terminal domain-containing protein [candidate division KSB1 bacterium]
MSWSKDWGNRKYPGYRAATIWLPTLQVHCWRKPTKPSIGGGRDIDAVAAIVKSHNAAIQYCYQRELKRNPNLRGKVVVRFIIDASGKVVEVSIVSSTLRNRRVERCIVNRIKRWNFGAIEKSKGNTAFKQVYTFGY